MHFVVLKAKTGSHLRSEAASRAPDKNLVADFADHRPLHCVSLVPSVSMFDFIVAKLSVFSRSFSWLVSFRR